MIFESIKKLVTYGLESGLIEESDRVYTTNRLLEALDLEEYDEPAEEFLTLILKALSKSFSITLWKRALQKILLYTEIFSTQNSWGFLLQDRQR